MRNLLVAFFLLSGAGNAFAVEFNLTGVWTYPEIPDSVQIISQSGNKVYSAAYHELNGNPAGVIGHAIGKVEGDKMSWKSTVTRRPNATWGGVSGETMQYFTISSDGKTISGTWKNDQGEGKVTLKKIK